MKNMHKYEKNKAFCCIIEKRQHSWKIRFNNAVSVIFFLLVNINKWLEQFCRKDWRLKEIQEEVRFFAKEAFEQIEENYVTFENIFHEAFDNFVT